VSNLKKGIFGKIGTSGIQIQGEYMTYIHGGGLPSW
jgi:hypothetical protein